MQRRRRSPCLSATAEELNHGLYCEQLPAEAQAMSSNMQPVQLTPMHARYVRRCGSAHECTPVSETREEGQPVSEKGA